MVVFCYALFVILVSPVQLFADQPRKDECRDNREEFGFALAGHDYKSTNADNFGRCFFECSLDERCQSATFLWNTKECKMKNETKISRPADFEENPAATYMENSFRAKKGSKASVPGFSCKDILISGDAQGDGEYWIDPTATGEPFTVYCDMVTDGGGWVLISRFVMSDSAQDETTQSDSYKTILPKYTSNKQYLLRNGFNQLKQDMGFTQIRFYCYKKMTDRVFHIMTNNNAKGANVVKYFTSSNSMPVACGSFTRLPDDNSLLAVNCDKWGYPTKNRWGHSSWLTDHRLYTRPIAWANTRFYRFAGNGVYQCDDTTQEIVSLNDIWQVFVR